MPVTKNPKFVIEDLKNEPIDNEKQTLLSDPGGEIFLPRNNRFQGANGMTDYQVIRTNSMGIQC